MYVQGVASAEVVIKCTPIFELYTHANAMLTEGHLLAMATIMLRSTGWI